MKKLLLVLILGCGYMISFASPLPNEKVAAVFQKTFPQVTNPHWSEHNGRYEVYFETDQSKLRLEYTSNGVLWSSIRYYSAELLNPFVKSRVMAKYPDVSVFGITEVINDGEMYYELVLEGAKSWMKVKSDAYGSLDLLDHWNKTESGTGVQSTKSY